MMITNVWKGSREGRKEGGGEIVGQPPVSE